MRIEIRKDLISLCFFATTGFAQQIEPSYLERLERARAHLEQQRAHVQGFRASEEDFQRRERFYARGDSWTVMFVPRTDPKARFYFEFEVTQADAHGATLKVHSKDHDIDSKIDFIELNVNRA